MTKLIVHEKELVEIEDEIVSAQLELLACSIKFRAILEKLKTLRTKNFEWFDDVALEGLLSEGVPNETSVGGSE